MAYLSEGDTPPKKGKGSKLSPKMVKFIDEYFIDFNATQAVLRAGYKTRNATQMGMELKRHPLVSQEIERRMSENTEKKEIERDYLLEKLINIIDNVEEKTADKIRAIELAGKSIALWKDRQEISGPDGGAIQTEQEVKREVEDFHSQLEKLTKKPSLKLVNGDGNAD